MDEIKINSLVKVLVNNDVLTGNYKGINCKGVLLNKATIHTNDGVSLNIDEALVQFDQIVRIDNV